MQTTTVVLILLAAILSLAIAWFQYFFKKKYTRRNLLLGFFRFVMVFALLLLLINPKFIKNSYVLEKANLILAVDNSSSIEALGGEVMAKDIVKEFRENQSLLDRFDFNAYSFENSLSNLDSLSFDAGTTNISNTLSTITEIYNRSNTAIILLSDGNHNLGADYEFANFNENTQIYPIVLGDTTTYEDIGIGQVNSNRYAFLNNKFPIEINVDYSGDNTVSTNARVFIDNKEVYRERINFDAKENYKTINTLLDASSIGVKNIRIQLDDLVNEKNTQNNQRVVALEVIDEKTNVTIISSIQHPDIGMLKKSIETNEQREVTILRPNTSTTVLDDTDVFILYQPNRSFRKIYDFIKNKGGSIFTITGPKTDWRFVNQIQSSFSKEQYNQDEEVVPIKNESFSLFDSSGSSFDGYPPLKTSLGDLLVTKPFEVIAYQKIKGVNLTDPLFLMIKDENIKEAVLFGEDIWKWRVQSFKEEKSFVNFDNLMSKVMLYLSDSSQKSRLELDYENVYGSTGKFGVRAAYFDETYTFDPNVNLNIAIRNTEKSFSTERPMLLGSNTYEVDLSDLEAGEYSFTVSVQGKNMTKSGKFTILDFDLESRFTSSNDDKLKRLAEKTNGQLYYPSQHGALIESLTTDPQLTPTQKSIKNIVSLIDFRWLLIIVVIALASEWFIRKYNGLL